MFFIVFISFFIILIIFFVWSNDRASKYFNVNNTDKEISKIINKDFININNSKNANSSRLLNANISDIKIGDKQYFDSKIALYFSYFIDNKKHYGVGLFTHTILPPYIKSLGIAVGDNDVIQFQEPIPSGTNEKKINILLYNNINKEVKKLKLKVYGQSINKINQFVDITNLDVYFNCFEMKNNGSIYFDSFFDANNKTFFPKNTD
jgi:hypothetical protein